MSEEASVTLNRNKVEYSACVTFLPMCDHYWLKFTIVLLEANLLPRG